MGVQHGKLRSMEFADPSLEALGSGTEYVEIDLIGGSIVTSHVRFQVPDNKRVFQEIDSLDRPEFSVVGWA